LPNLRERIPVPTPPEAVQDLATDAQTQFLKLEDCPEVKSLWEQYVQDKWWPWAEEDRRLQTVQKVYTDLFSIYQKQQRLGEAYEVVLGLGFLAWRTQSGHEVRRHVITAQTALSFDATRGVIALGPAGEGAKPILEQDMLEPQERPDPDHQNAIEGQVAEVGDALWDRVQVQAALQGWVHAVSPRGLFENTLVPQGATSSDPILHLAPAVILRKRTERSFIRVFQEIVSQLQAGQPIPLGVRRLVSIVDDAGATTGSDEAGAPEEHTSQPAAEIYFPLPANEEQKQIAQELSNRQGILVQGPPGTGKSHTIANLVCHLLATGSRVLVTSHTARALKVLRDKFPKDISDLCVILLGDDLTARQTLEDSVRGITDRHHHWDPRKNQEHIAGLERRLDEVRRAEASTLTRLRQMREADTYRHRLPFGEYEGTTQVIAARLCEEEEQHKWMAARPEEASEPPLKDAEALDLLRLLRQIDADQESELSRVMLDPASLISPEQFLMLVRSEAELQTQHETAGDAKDYPGYSALARIPGDQRETLLRRLSDLRGLYETLAQHPQRWVREAASDIVIDRGRPWRELLDGTKTHLAAIGDRARRAAERQIAGLGDRNRSAVKAEASALLQHCEAARGFGIPGFRPRVVKDALYLIKTVRVDGQRCHRPGPLRALLEWIDVADRLQYLRNQWGRHIEAVSGPFHLQVAEYQNNAELLEQILQLNDRKAGVREIFAAAPGLAEPRWHDPEDLRAVEAAMKAADAAEKLAQVRNRLDTAEAQLRTVAADRNAHSVLAQAAQAVLTRNVTQYAAASQLLRDLQKSRNDLTLRQGLLARLAAAAPETAALLVSSYIDPLWDQRLVRFTAAWNWARADTWLHKVADTKEQEALVADLDRHRKSIRDLLRDLAAARAWRHCFARLTEHERQHLVAWVKAVRLIGKGTGKYAVVHRRAAREHMQHCRSAIPAWIMPIYRVAESVRPGIDTFDVVIVDEASQSGPEALFLQYLARRIVVVGDDKQISPEFVGLNREDVELLRRRRLSDIPHADALGVDHSFFDQADIRYGRRIRLREHFRCMPEIIQFSNNLCYPGEPLVPLRRYGAGRLAPVIVVRHVPDGYQRGKSPRVDNPPEAHALVEQIRKCCEDPAYEGKTMGVISLLGDAQARLIERLLLDKIGPEEMEHRHLVCGDAYAFQGDERDVMFLGLVSAPGEGVRIGTLTSERDRRRFNVAASRAKDQMWLFHTATLNDLSPNCLRYRLLEYCLNPQVQPSSVEGLALDELWRLSRSRERDKRLPPHPFESWFELDVFLKIAERGYRVIPQFEVAGYRIDLVIEGMQGRLAVECDGDTWHGLERYDEDMARQRMLERCQWTFWRVRGNAFYRDQGGALAGLWSTLARLGIHAASQDSQASEQGEFWEQKEGVTALSGENRGIERGGFKEVEEPMLSQQGDPVALKGAGRVGSEPILDVEPSGGEASDVPTPTVSTDETVKILETPLLPTLLVPHRPWAPRTLPDPRLARVDDVMAGLIEIVEVEGPMPCHRAYRLYAKAAGIGRVGRLIRSFFNRGIRKAIHLGLIDESNEYQRRDQMNQIVRKRGTPPVIPRTRGDRVFDEIPPAEIGLAMKFLLQQDPTLQGERLLYAVSRLYEIGRLTSNIQRALLWIKEQYVDRTGADGSF
jgi:very-short-patch-repair endonuclease